MPHAIVVSAFGGPEVLEYVEVDMPLAGPGEVVVRVAAAGINYIDVYRRSGKYPVELPGIPGAEASGTVSAIGPGVTSVAVGDRVAFPDNTGGYAEYVIASAAKCLPVPDGIDDLTAAAIPMQLLTAHYLVDGSYQLEAGDTCLIHAGAGGVGLVLTQLAKLKGARVITTVSTPEKAELSRDAGADHVIGYENFDTVVRDITDGVGVNVVYDGVGKDTFDGSLASLRNRGMLVSFGSASGAVPPFDISRLVQGGSLSITRPTLGSFVAEPAERAWRWKEVTDAVLAGDVTVRIDQTYKLSDAPQAHRDLEARLTTGKSLLIPEDFKLG
jgi:NADPH2:quinone reductase